MKVCPKCKKEYGNKKTQCTKCKVRLVKKNIVNNSSKDNIYDAEEEKLKELEAISDLNTSVLDTEPATDAVVENDVETVVDDTEIAAESDELDESTDLEDDIEEEPSIRNFMPESEVTYKYKRDVYADNSSSAYILLIFGCGGLFDIVLNILGIFNMFTSIFQYIVGILTFSAFILFSMYSFKKAKQIKKEIDKEEDDIVKIKKLLEQYVTIEFLTECDKKDISDEENYFRRIEKIKDMVKENLKDLEEGLLELVIEEFYNERF